MAKGSSKTWRTMLLAQSHPPGLSFWYLLLSLGLSLYLHLNTRWQPVARKALNMAQQTSPTCNPKPKLDQRASTGTDCSVISVGIGTVTATSSSFFSSILVLFSSNLTLMSFNVYLSTLIRLRSLAMLNSESMWPTLASSALPVVRDWIRRVLKHS